MKLPFKGSHSINTSSFFHFPFYFSLTFIHLRSHYFCHHINHLHQPKIPSLCDCVIPVVRDRTEESCHKHRASCTPCEHTLYLLVQKNCTLLLLHENSTYWGCREWLIVGGWVTYKNKLRSVSNSQGKKICFFGRVTYASKPVTVPPLFLAKVTFWFSTSVQDD